MDGASEVSSRSIYASNADAAPMISGNDDTARGSTSRQGSAHLDSLAAPDLVAAGDLFSLRSCRRVVIEELLNLCWDGSRLHCDVGPMAPERMLPLLCENGVAIPIFVCTRPVYFFAIVCHPFFVFGQCEVALFELPKFVGFGRQASRFQQLCVFGRFRTISALL
jgi:hypothetical protein